MSNVTIRNFESGDLEGCRGLWRELIEHHRQLYEDDSIGGDDPGALFDPHLERVGAERIWVAQENGRVLGLASLLMHENEDDEREIPEIEPVVVASERRGEGIGRMLTEAVVDGAVRLGVTYLCVKPVARNSDAVAFFHEAGFRTVGHVQLFRELGATEPHGWKAGIRLSGRDFTF
jgi:L-amino acid N-acyltransferase YncA